MVCSRLLVEPIVLYPLVEACDVLPLLLLPQLVGLELKVSYQLHSRHLLPTQWHNLTGNINKKKKPNTH